MCLGIVSLLLQDRITCDCPDAVQVCVHTKTCQLYFCCLKPSLVALFLLHQLQLVSLRSQDSSTSLLDAIFYGYPQKIYIELALWKWFF